MSGFPVGRFGAAACFSLALVSPAAAQGTSTETPSLRLDALVAFYGDNTEFSNDFREGETLLGTFAHVVGEARLSPRIAVRAGVFGRQAFGSEDSFESVRPVLSLVVGGPASRLVVGTLDTTRHLDGGGPDRTGPHGLLPPVQGDALLLERPWEAGVQWTIDTPRVTQDAWVHWQRIATQTPHAAFDGGLVHRLQVRRGFALRLAGHLVRGGRLPATDVDSDSWTTAAGIEARQSVGRLDRLSVELSLLVSRSEPKRSQAGLGQTGVGGFLRVAAEEGHWRLHAIAWRANDFINQEGDPHYQSVRRDGTRFRPIRDYAEVGLTRTSHLASGAFVEASARWHLVETRSEYSFRILAVAELRVPLLR